MSTHLNYTRSGECYEAQHQDHHSHHNGPGPDIDLDWPDFNPETYQTVWIAGITLAVLVVVLIVSIVFNRRSTTRPASRIIESLNERADQVASAAGQVSSTSQQMAAGISIEETLSSLEEMYSRTRTTRGKRTA